MHDARTPALFISHGAPTLAIEDGPAHRFLREYGERLGRPRAVVVLSAHYEAPVATVTTSEWPEMIYDFRGFPPSLYDIVYPAPGHPDLAEDIAGLLEQSGIPVRRDPRRGLDHGAWVPLHLMYPLADVPVLQVSIDPARGAAYHYRLGELLAPLRDDGVLLIGSGGATHNLPAYFRGGPGDSPPAWVAGFNEWLADRVIAGDVDDLLEYRGRAPEAAENHPTDEHFLPLLAALGAAADATKRRRVHRSYQHGVLSMDAYEFGFARRA